MIDVAWQVSSVSSVSSVFFCLIYYSRKCSCRATPQSCQLIDAFRVGFFPLFYLLIISRNSRRNWGLGSNLFQIRLCLIPRRHLWISDWRQTLRLRLLFLGLFIQMNNVAGWEQLFFFTDGTIWSVISDDIRAALAAWHFLRLFSL